jgi:hypothetical protein
MAKCRSCDKRNAGTGATLAEGDIKTARELGLCVPCLVDGEWENEHNDNGHTTAAPVEGCWACHPELNPDRDGAPEPRKGSSRAGVVHCVRRRDTGREKAQTVAAHVVKKISACATPKVRSYAKGTVSCRIVSELGTVRLDWDADGHFLPTSKIERDGASRKVRNVSEAYRLLHIAK